MYFRKNQRDTRDSWRTQEITSIEEAWKFGEVVSFMSWVMVCWDCKGSVKRGALGWGRMEYLKWEGSSYALFLDVPVNEENREVFFSFSKLFFSIFLWF